MRRDARSNSMRYSIAVSAMAKIASGIVSPIAFAVLILILVFRPAGILGKLQVEKV